MNHKLVIKYKKNIYNAKLIFESFFVSYEHFKISRTEVSKHILINESRQKSWKNLFIS